MLTAKLAQGLQRLRKVLYELRMADDFSSTVDAFFADLAEPTELLALFDYLPEVYLYVKDTQGRFMRVNRAMLMVRGIESESDIIGKTDLDIHPTYWAMRYIEEDRLVIRSRQRLIDQVWLVPNSDGRLEPWLSTKIPIFNKSGECVGIAGVRRALNAEPSEAGDQRGISAAARMITQNYARQLAIKDLARLANLSHSQFNRRFSAAYRMSPSSYLQRVRVHEASRRLIDSQRAIGEIALQVGFYDQAHLTRTFKKIMGVTPMKFRQLHRDETKG